MKGTYLLYSSCIWYCLYILQYYFYTILFGYSCFIISLHLTLFTFMILLEYCCFYFILDIFSILLGYFFHIFFTSDIFIHSTCMILLGYSIGHFFSYFFFDKFWNLRYCSTIYSGLLGFSSPLLKKCNSKKPSCIHRQK